LSLRNLKPKGDWFVMDKIIQKEKNELQYFEDEMHYLTQAGEEFAKKYPAIAGNLELGREGSSDPHVQQVLESFAFLAGNLQKQIDQNSLLLSYSLMESLFPNLALPIPSLSVLELRVNEGNPALLKSMTVSRGTEFVYTSTFESQYKFRTIYDTELCPVKITEFKIGNINEYDFLMSSGAQILSVGMQLFDGEIEKKSFHKLRFYLDMRRSIANKVMDILFTNCREIYIYSDDKKYYKLDPSHIKHVGFNEDETLFLSNKKSFDVCKTMQEYFLLPEKFLFFDLDGLDLEKVNKNFKIIFVCESGEVSKLNIETKNLKLRCTPIINLFPIISEPVKTRSERNEYLFYTNYLKNKFLIFHSIEKLKYFDIHSKEKEIRPVKDYVYLKYDKGEDYYYEIKTDRNEPNLFKINLYNNKSMIFNDDMTMYADIYASNGFFCEKMNMGEQLHSVRDSQVRYAELLKSPTYYIENDLSNQYYWSMISRLYSEKISFYDEKELLSDLRDIIKNNVNINLEKEGIKTVSDNIVNVANSLEDLKILTKYFKVDDKKKNFFVKGKEVNLIVSSNKIGSDSIVIFAEVIFSILKNASLINQCVSLILIEKATQKVLYSCKPNLGHKRSF